MRMALGLRRASGPERSSRFACKLARALPGQLRKVRAAPETMPWGRHAKLLDYFIMVDDRRLASSSLQHCWSIAKNAAPHVPIHAGQKNKAFGDERETP